MSSARVHRPPRIAVRIEGGIQNQELHLRTIVRVDVSDVAPVSTERSIIVREIVGEYPSRSNQIWQKILSEFVTAIEVSGVAQQGFAQCRHIENINSHAREPHGRIGLLPLGIFRLFLEMDNLPPVVNVENSQFFG